MFIISLFKHSLMFMGKARTLPSSGAPEKCKSLVGSGLTRQILDYAGMDKHSSL